MLGGQVNSSTVIAVRKLGIDNDNEHVNAAGNVLGPLGKGGGEGGVASLGFVF